MAPAPERRAGNAVPDDPDWCGHAMIDLTTWRCDECGRVVPEPARRRMESAPTLAPPGHVWVLTEGPVYDEGFAGGAVVGVFSDRAAIGRLLVRDSIISAARLRAELARLTWYQSIFNPAAIEAWGTDRHGRGVSYRLGLEQIDHPG